MSVSGLMACTNVIDEASVPQAIGVGDLENIYVATNRDLGPDGQFGIGRSNTLHFLDLAISLPPNRDVGVVTAARENPNPAKHFAIAQRTVFADEAAFNASLKRKLHAKSLAAHEVTVFVHGYNNGFSEAAYRAAQLKHDLQSPNEIIAFSWPSRGSAFGYEYDKDSTFAARDSLEQLLIHLDQANVGKILLVGHSMGAFLSMESLRQIDLKDPGWSARTLSGVVLISPDIAVDVFHAQARRIKPLPSPFIVFSSSEDRALRVMARLTGQPSRLGNLSNVAEISDLEVTFVDVSAFSEDSATSHFVAGSSPALIAMIAGASAMDKAFLRGQTGVAGMLPASRKSVNSATEIVLESDR